MDSVHDTTKVDAPPILVVIIIGAWVMAIGDFVIPSIGSLAGMSALVGISIIESIVAAKVVPEIEKKKVLRVDILPKPTTTLTLFFSSPSEI